VLQHVFDQEQEQDEQQKTDQYLVAAFVMLPVKAFVATVDKERSDNKGDQKQPRENHLTL
jgi:hypothetical protein